MSAFPQTELSILSADTLVVADEVKVSVGRIIITGNKKTRPFIILRELPFKTGDQYTLDVLVKKMETARRQLMNTTLFLSVIVASPHIDGEVVDILVEVKERWYIFPLPFFRPVDRNLNQWLVEQKGSLARVNYGAKLLYNNVTGRNDKVRAGVTNGYTKQIIAGYERPYIDRHLKWGMKFAFATGKNREINYNTIGDKQVFIKSDREFLRRFTSVNTEFSYRRAIKTRHIFGIAYTRERIADTVLALNKDYFVYNRKLVSFPGMYYTLNYLDLDYNPYPTKGYAATVTLARSGFSRVVDVWSLQAKGLGAWPVTATSFVSVSVYGGIKFPFHQPYYTRRFLGYGDIYMQGFEYNVVDGVAGGYVKTTFTKQLINLSFHAPAGKKGGERPVVPLRVFAKIFGNAGYVHHPQPGDNYLNNRMLYSAGVGIDILTIYDVNFKLEWTFNSVGKNGIYFHQNSIF